eukprot:1229644-Amphidinium_carterae.3
MIPKTEYQRTNSFSTNIFSRKGNLAPESATRLFPVSAFSLEPECMYTLECSNRHLVLCGSLSASLCTPPRPMTAWRESRFSQVLTPHPTDLTNTCAVPYLFF